MARVKSYSNDNTLSTTDRLFGTDSAGGLNSTSNFTLGDLKDFVALGVDITKRTPRYNVPIVNADSTDGQPSTVSAVVETLNKDIKFYNVDPGTDTPVTEEREILKGDFTLVNEGTEGWFLYIKDYRAKYDLTSYQTKNFRATIVVGGEDEVVTGTIGDLQEVDEKYYIVDTDNDVSFKYAVTRTGVIADTWGKLVSSRNSLTNFDILAADNSSGTLGRVTIQIDGNATLQQVLVEGDLEVKGEFDAKTIVFNENAEGIIYKDKNNTTPGEVNLLLRDDSTPGTGNFKAAPIEGYHNAGSMPVLSQVSETVEGALLKSFLNIETPVFDYEKMIFTTADSQTDDGGDGAERSLRRVEIDHTGITYYHTDGDKVDEDRLDATRRRKGGKVQPVIANNIAEYKKPAGPDGDPEEGPELEGVLTTLQIGDQYYNVPTSVSQVAQTLPGLSEKLEGVPDDSINIFDQSNVGRSNATTILADDSVTGTIFDSDEGNFAFYNVASGETLSINSTNALVLTGTDNVEPERDAADLPNTNHFVIVNDHLRGIAVGDKVVLYNNTAGSTNYLEFTVDSAVRGTVQGVGTKNFGDDFWVLSFDDLAFTDGSFSIATGEAETYRMRVYREGASGSTTNTHTFFYGDDHGTFVTYHSGFTGDAPTTRTLLNNPNEVSITFDQDDNLNRIFDAIPAGAKLFFSTAALPGTLVGSPDPIANRTVIPGNVYEVVGYLHDNGNDDGGTPPVTQATMTYSLVGQGNLVINSRVFRISNLPDQTTNNPQFLTIDPADSQNRVKLTSVTEVAGLNSIVSWDDTESTRDGVVGQITFDGGSENHNLVAGGANINVDITGRNNWSSFPATGDGTTTSFTADIWHEYVLSTITATRTITLPASADLEPGEKITIHNLADIDTDGTPRAYTVHWQVATPGTERIMKDTGNLVLNEATSFDIIWTGNPAIGWIVK